MLFELFFFFDFAVVVGIVAVVVGIVAVVVDRGEDDGGASREDCLGDFGGNLGDFVL